ncbi:hypothetical protein [Actinokineospora terrae]|uniref:Uncharacterized protein n=1 Tax=Actinokineospora terrae TaxID=155974 RepID=A0A1H9UR32_9PSEU|nr:hypothetical protein [Actinokineospora terrae]SES11483.1 hypothetical protein SAMN04487818_107399 [Actinokineospora terrae]
MTVLLGVLVSWGFVFLSLRLLVRGPVREIRVRVRLLPVPVLDVVVTAAAVNGDSGKTGRAIPRR